MTTSYKCPNCAAGLIFDPDIGKMSCSFCGSRVYPEDISDKENIEAYHAGDVYKEESEVYNCNNCGAEVLVPDDVTSSFCAFCGSASIILSKLSGKAKPLWIAPFNYGRDEAEKAFVKWCKGKKLLPFNFLKRSNINKLNGMYMPFWLYDYAVDVNAEVDNLTQRYGSDKYSVRTVVKKGMLLWEKVPISATKEIDDLLIEMVEPFNYDQLEPFAG